MSHRNSVPAYPTQYLEEDTMSEEGHSNNEQFNYEEYTTTTGGNPAAVGSRVINRGAPSRSIPVPGAVDGSREFQHQRSHTARQYPPDRRYIHSSSPQPPATARYRYSEQPPQPRGSPVRLTQSGRPQATHRYAQDYVNYPPQPSQPPPQPPTASAYQYVTPGHGPNKAAHQPRYAPALPPHQQRYPAGRSPPGHISPQLLQRIAQHQQRQAQPELISPESISAAFEEIRTSTAAKNIAAAAAAAAVATSGGDCVPNVGQSQQQPKTNASSTANHACGDGSTVDTAGIAGAARSVPSDTSALSSEITSGSMAATAAPSFAHIIDQAVGLERSKKMIVNLIDSALDSLKTKQSQSKQSLGASNTRGRRSTNESVADIEATASQMSMADNKIATESRSMKRECIQKIEDQLERLKQLEEFSDVGGL